MTYRKHDLAFPVALNELSLAEAERLFKAFTHHQQARIDELSRLVRSSKGFETWMGDGSRDSLVTLGKWFADNITTRKRSDQEMRAIRARMPTSLRGVELEDWDLTDDVFSVAIDIAIYFAYVIRLRVPNVDWQLVGGKPPDVNSRQTVLHGRGKVDLNPANIVITLAYGLARKTKHHDRLAELFDIWSAMLNGD